MACHDPEYGEGAPSLTMPKPKCDVPKYGSIVLDIFAAMQTPKGNSEKYWRLHEQLCGLGGIQHQATS